MSNKNKNVTSGKSGKIPASNRSQVTRSKTPNNCELVKQPSAFGYTARASTVSASGSGKIVIRKREFVGAATNGSTTGFSVSSLSTATPGYDINPGCPMLFPWLSQVASAFERFRFNKLSFEFIPNQATSTAGRYYAAVDYDYDDIPATTKTGLMGNITSVEAPLWGLSSLRCDPASLNRDMPYRYVSATSRTAVVDLRTSNSGFLMVGFDTQNTNSYVDIWVEYEVELVTPVIEVEMPQFMPVANTNLTYTANVTGAQGTAYTSYPPPMNVTIPRGVVKLVNCGAPGVPLLSYTTGGAAANASYALDIKDAKTDGTLTYNTLFYVSGATPATVLAAGVAPLSDIAVYDDSGTYLGLAFGSTGVTRVAGCLVSTQLATTSGCLLSTCNMIMSYLYSTYPTARYLVNVLVTLSALGAGYTGFTFNYQK